MSKALNTLSRERAIQLVESILSLAEKASSAKLVFSPIANARTGKITNVQERMVDWAEAAIKRGVER